MACSLLGSTTEALIKTLIIAMKIITIIGARPQFVKAATVSRVISSISADSDRPSVQEVIVHTGQHYDDNMSRVFFDEMGIPPPHYNLAVGSGNHGHMTGQMLARIEEVLLHEKPDRVLVYGDTNSTLAGALAAAKLNIPVAHVEAGLRSYNKRMPEEINRVLTDHLSQTLFVPTRNAIDNLKKEGITQGIVCTGDVMLDAFLLYKKKAAEQSKILKDTGLSHKKFYLATIHRQENTDDRHRLAAIFGALREIGTMDKPVVLPLHPRTRKKLHQFNLQSVSDAQLQLLEPVGYLDMIQLENAADLIFTDSGGVQKEAYFAGVPCITLRAETEWIETIEAGVNFLADADANAIMTAYEKAGQVRVSLKNGLYGDGHAADAVVNYLKEFPCNLST
jgi:UDP-GlcNAc3NAcA epimerase